MKPTNLVWHHMKEQIHAAIADADGFHDEAAVMRAQARLRLITMTDEELQQLAVMWSQLPDRPSYVVYADIRRQVQYAIDSADDWLWAFGLTPKPLHEVKPWK